MYTSFEAIGALLLSEYHLDLDEYFIRTHSINALDEMGLIEKEEVLLRLGVKDYEAKLPPNIGEISRIHWVISEGQIPESTIKVEIQNIWFPPQTFFVPIPNSDAEVLSVSKDTPLNIIPDVKGPYIPYTRTANSFKFNTTNVNVLAKIERVKGDANGLPLIPEDAARACMAYCAEIYYKPMYLRGKIPSNVYKDIKEEASREFARCQNRIGFKQLDQGAMNNVQDQAVSWDRKAYGVDS